MASIVQLTSAMRFTLSYRQEVVLGDGTLVTLRAIRPDDKANLVAVLAGMSVESRVQRFFVARSSFSESELRYLTELDGVDHYALLALHRGQPVAVARLVRTDAALGVAEPAFAIVDRFQRRGLGCVLVSRLADAARERGIERFEAEVLPQNRAMLKLFRGLDPAATRGAVPSVDSITCRMDLGLQRRPCESGTSVAAVRAGGTRTAFSQSWTWLMGSFTSPDTV